MSPLDRSLVRAGLALGLLALSALPAAASDGDSYGYFRVIEGSATLMQNDGDRQPAEVNQPVLAGDRIWVANRSRVEIVLADRNILRLDGDSEITLDQLAASPDRDDPATVIRLHDGNILLTVTTDSLGDQLPRVDTPNATVYTQHYGTYRITASQDRFTEVVVRRGKAEVVTDRSSEIVNADESAFVEGERYADVDVESAGSYDALERWADRLEGEARYAGNDYIDDDLRYHAAPLARHGAWIHIGGRPYWRPRVDVGWRPYWQGRWAYTPSGLTWISYEPWGWVPYHYGSWDYISSYGWVWAPGRRWAPAWVYWYWGPSYVGWCPTGYYMSYYRHRYPYFRSGVYGWAGGGWDGWDHWSFIRHDYFRGYRNGYRDGFRDGRHNDHWDVRRYAVPRDELRRRGEIDRGVITTDTRPLKPDTWDEPRHAIGVLTRDRGRGAEGGLPDVTPFIQRRPDLPNDVVRTVVPRDGEPGGQGGERPRVAERPRGASPWEGGVMPTDPSQEPRTVRRERPAPGGPSAGEVPRVRVPREGGVVVDREGDRPRAGRPQPGEGGGAPRPDSAGQSDSSDSNERRGSEPRTRVAPRETTPQDSGGESPRGEVRSRRPEAGSPGGSPRPSRPEANEPPPSSSRRRPEPPQSYDQPRSQEREREAPPQQQESPQARERERESPPPPRDDDAPQARERERERESPPPPSSERRRPDPPRSHESPRSYEAPRSREREAPPSYAPSRPERREEARPSRPSEPSRSESARPSERERSGSRGGESRGGESRSGDRGGQSSSSRGSRSRPPGD